MRGLFIRGDLVGFCGSVYDASHESKHTSWLHSHLIKFLTISKSGFFFLNLALLTPVILLFLIELKNRLLHYFLRCVSSNLHSQLLDAKQQMVMHVMIMVVAELVHNIKDTCFKA